MSKLSRLFEFSIVNSQTHSLLLLLILLHCTALHSLHYTTLHCTECPPILTLGIHVEYVCYGGTTPCGSHPCVLVHGNRISDMGHCLCTHTQTKPPLPPLLPSPPLLLQLLLPLTCCCCPLPLPLPLHYKHCTHCTAPFECVSV